MPVRRRALGGLDLPVSDPLALADRDASPLPTGRDQATGESLMRRTQSHLAGHFDERNPLLVILLNLTLQRGAKHGCGRLLRPQLDPANSAEGKKLTHNNVKEDSDLRSGMSTIVSKILPDRRAAPSRTAYYDCTN